MGKRRTSALAQEREPESTSTEPSRSEKNESEPASREPARSPLRMSMILWGLPLLFFVVVAVLKECAGVSIW